LESNTPKEASTFSTKLSTPPSGLRKTTLFLHCQLTLIQQHDQHRPISRARHMPPYNLTTPITRTSDSVCASSEKLNNWEGRQQRTTDRIASLAASWTRYGNSMSTRARHSWPSRSSGTKRLEAEDANVNLETVVVGADLVLFIVLTTAISDVSKRRR
jgi:hypothetical protein